MSSYEDDLREAVLALPRTIKALNAKAVPDLKDPQKIHLLTIYNIVTPEDPIEPEVVKLYRNKLEKAIIRSEIEAFLIRISRYHDMDYVFRKAIVAISSVLLDN